MRQLDRNGAVGKKIRGLGVGAVGRHCKWPAHFGFPKGFPWLNLQVLLGSLFGD